MKRIILLTIILLSTYSFKLSAQIIKKYKDGVSIDSLVVMWPIATYKDVITIINEQRIEHNERSSSYDVQISYNPRKVKKIESIDLYFSKIYYKGLYIGEGYLSFSNSKNIFNKETFPLTSFDANTAYRDDFGFTPNYKDILTTYIDLRTLYLERYGATLLGVYGADSLVTADSDAELIFSHLKNTKESIGYRWILYHIGDTMDISLRLHHNDFLIFSIGWYPEFVPEKAKKKRK